MPGLGTASRCRPSARRWVGTPTTSRSPPPSPASGRLYAGGAALDVAAALLSMRDGVIPPTVNLDDPAEGCDLAFVTGEAREAHVRTALVLARGHGGFNGALVLRRDVA